MSLKVTVFMKKRKSFIWLLLQTICYRLSLTQELCIHSDFVNYVCLGRNLVSYTPLNMSCAFLSIRMYIPIKHNIIWYAMSVDDETYAIKITAASHSL